MDINAWFHDFCGGPLWNSSLLLDNWWPQLTPCFLTTVLVWIPCGFVWLLLPYFLYDLHDELSTNNIQLLRTEPQGSKGNGGVPQKDGLRSGHFRMTTVCTLKMISAGLLAVMSTIQLLMAVIEERKTSETVAAVVYLVTYILVSCQIWCERRKGRNPSGVAFYFHAMNVLFGIVPLYTWILTEDLRTDTGRFTLVVLSLVLNVLSLLLTMVPDTDWTRPVYSKLAPGQGPNPEAMATYPSRLFFCWMLKLMLTGFKRDITSQDLWQLHPRDQSRRLTARFETLWQAETARVQQINKRRNSSQAVHTLYKDDGWDGVGQQNGARMYPDDRPYRKSRRRGYAQDGAYDSETTLLLENKAEESSKKKDTDHHGEPLSPSLGRVLAKLLWKDVITVLIQKISVDVSLLINPLILGELIKFLQSTEETRVWQPYLLSLAMVVFGYVKSVIFANCCFKSALIGLHVKSALVAAIYKKALVISSSAKKTSTVGEIVNLMSVDCQRLQDNFTVIVIMCTAPLQVILTAVFVYNYLGAAGLTGIGLLLVLMPLTSWVGARQKQIQDSILKKKDERIKVVNQVLNGMKVLKLYAWEDQFKKKIEGIRALEIRNLYKIAFLNCISALCWGLAPFFVGMVTFVMYVLLDENNVLDAQKAFVSLALFNIIKMPLSLASTLIAYAVQISVSVKRVNTFLMTENLKSSNTKFDPNTEHAISIQNGTFTWDGSQPATLKNINEIVPTGALTAIVGPVGAGKTSLVSAILGEMVKLQGQVTVKGKVAYVSQQAWIQNATVRDNILFGKEFHKKRYTRVLKVCELERDLSILEAGDLTEIGEKGINLSGGQKQRVNLARAVYSQADLYLFDDPLSAVDAHVGKAIFNNVVSSQGLLASKTRVLVTHGIHWLPQVDHILVLSEGTVCESGSYPQLVSRNGPFAQFLQMYLAKQNKEEDDDYSQDEELHSVLEEIKANVDLVTSDTGNTSADEVYHLQPPKIHHRLHDKSQKEGNLEMPLMIHETLDLSTTLTSGVTPVFPVTGKLIVAEKLETGKVKRDVFAVFARACGLWAIGVAFLSFVLCQGFLTWSSFFLTEWTEDPILLNASTGGSPEGRARLNYYLVVYGGFFSVSQILTFALFNYLLWFRMVRATDRLHHLLLDRLFHAPMSFFDQTPVGRILNRFAKDVDTIDNTIPVIMKDFLLTAAMLLVTAVVILVESPMFGAVLVPLLVFFYTIQNYYVRTSRQLKRIESITRSPIYVHFSETISGAPVIRAYQASDRFIQESLDRLDTNQLYFYACQAAIRWLQLYMDVVANLVVFFAAIFQITGGGRGGDAGLSVSYALQISTCITYMVRQVCEVETNIVSVERLKEYSEVEQEAALVIPEQCPSPSWPDKGQVTFSKFQARYRPGLDLVLKGVNCDIRAGEKIGVVGRTGAGKSSLTLCLFRIMEGESGCITIDGVNIAQIGLHDLRSRLTILPQDPVLFSGSLRMNLDPFGQYTDQQLWTALDRSHLRSFVSTHSSGLMYECGEDGSNLSVGQRQLVCLARSLLRHTKILVLDEATAAIDIETDTFIQKTIREEFSDCTIIAIAHRLNTIMDYDRIIVMDAGLIAEFDTPQNLINSRGIFYTMCQDSKLL